MLGNNISRIAMPITYSNVEWRLDSNGLHGKNERQNIHIIYFYGFDYSVHLNLCGNAVVLTGIRLVAGIHECLSEFFCETLDCGQVRSIDSRALAYMFDLQFYLTK